MQYSGAKGALDDPTPIQPPNDLNEDPMRAAYIAAETQEQMLHLSFADDGAGMPASSVARVFEPFFTTRRGQGGSGLGLYICYNLVTTRLGGTIHCTSAANAGCRFDIHFPIQVPHRLQKDAS